MHRVAMMCTRVLNVGSLGSYRALSQVVTEKKEDRRTVHLSRDAANDAGDAIRSSPSNSVLVLTCAPVRLGACFHAFPSPAFPRSRPTSVGQSVAL
jgi:hypothetical protein